MCESLVLRFADLKQQVKQLIEKQDWISAHATLLKMQDISPNNYKLSTKIGNIYEKLGHFDAAEFYYTKAIKIEPNNDFGYYNLAILYMNHQQYDVSKQNFLRCFQIDYNKAVTHYWYAQCLIKTNAIRDAFLHFRKAANIKPQISNYHYFAGKTALLFNTTQNNIIANKYLQTAIKLTNQNEIRYINEYVMHWDRWTWNDNLLSIKSTMHYLYLYAVYASKNDETMIGIQYINLCRYALKNVSQFPELNKKYILQCIERALTFDSLNYWLWYEKYRILDEMKYGICNTDNILSNKIITSKYYNCDCGDWRSDYSDTDEKKEREDNGNNSVLNIVKIRCKLIVDEYISHNNLCIDESLIIPNEIRYLCLRYLIGEAYMKTLSNIDRVGSMLNFHDCAKNEMIEMIFHSIFPSENKLMFTIAKILHYIDKILPSIGCRHGLNKLHINNGYVPPVNCKCKYTYLLCGYYVLYLVLFSYITSLSDELIKLDKIDDEYYEKLLFIPFKLVRQFKFLILPSRPLFISGAICQTVQFELYHIVYQFLTQLLMNNDEFYNIYCDLLFGKKRLFYDSSYCSLLSIVAGLHTFTPCIHTMRFVMGPLLFYDEPQRKNYKPLTVNLQSLENLIVEKLDGGSFEYDLQLTIALYWWQLECNNSNWNNVAIDKIVTKLWKNLERIGCNLNYYVLEACINQGVYLKTSELSWNEFFQIIQNPLILRYFGDILKSYCSEQMLKDKYNKHHWEHCVSLLSDAN